MALRVIALSTCYYHYPCSFVMRARSIRADFAQLYILGECVLSRIRGIRDATGMRVGHRAENF